MTSLCLPLAVSLALVAVAAGCGGGESSEPVATTKVAMVKSYRFEPGTIEIDAGRSVTWTNEDNFTHTVQVDGREDHKVERDDSVSIEFAIFSAKEGRSSLLPTPWTSLDRSAIK